MDVATLILLALATALVIYIVQRERNSGTRSLMRANQRNPARIAEPPTKREVAPTPDPAQEPALGSRRKSRGRRGLLNCDNVSLDSPDFARCSTTLGSGRTVIGRKPTGDNNASSYRQAEYSLGNPFAMKTSDNDRSDKGVKYGDAFPFTEQLSREMRNQASPRKTKPPGAKSIWSKFYKASDKTNKSKPSAYSPKKHRKQTTTEALNPRDNDLEGVPVKKAFLGAAISPSAAVSIGPSKDEIKMATNKLDTVNKVSSNTGGNLNLLHPLEFE